MSDDATNSQGSAEPSVSPTGLDRSALDVPLFDAKFKAEHPGTVYGEEGSSTLSELRQVVEARGKQRGRQSSGGDDGLAL
jgi:hypothetical protein